MDIYKEKLIELYERSSKHSHYQRLPEKINQILGLTYTSGKTRYEVERLNYILESVPISNKFVLDIGGNTGYFSFAMLDNGAKAVRYFEGNPTHAEFVKLASEILNLDSKLQIVNKYFLFDVSNKEKYDVALLLNVLHHTGDDYGDEDLSIETAKMEILKQLNNFAATTKILVFQLGFNWKGDRRLGLFPHGTKRELIDFITKGTRENWEVLKIGVPQLIDGKIEYMNLGENNIKRQDELGEFLNRPLFIMKSKKF
ncbi:MAG: hypothetical protein PHT78_13255 [Desulfitobacteriaceae bacterium]|jgi:SAM-dependent methyltransferase|nr:hypothetical protein [Desulfitobacteriaceae bacterium]